MPSLHATCRAWLLRRVRNGTSTVVAFQRLCGVSLETKGGDEFTTSDQPVIRNQFLYYLFMTAAAMGNELFYILALPALFWLVNVDLARRIIMLWWIVYYVGQSVKDLMCLPRPPSPPTAKLERHYETEYGFPSTHAMVSFTLPLYSLFALDNLGHEVNWTVGLTCCAVWCATITCSRLYVGVHSVCDLVGGFFFGTLVLAFGLVIGEPVDHFVITSALGPLIAVLVSFVLIWSYPAPHAWTNAYGDTSLIIAVASGICVGQSVYFHRFPAIALSITGDDLGSQLFSVGGAVLAVVARLLLGCTILFLTRSLAKKAAHFLWLPFILPKYFAFCTLMPTPRAGLPIGLKKKVAAAAATATTIIKRVPSDPTSQLDATEESGVWELTPMSDSMKKRSNGSQSASVSRSSSPIAAPVAPATPVAPIALRPVAPRQFRLRIDAAATGSSRPASPVCSSPLEALLTRSPSPAPHKMLQDGATTLVEFTSNGETVVINPAHVYLVEIPIKYITYFSVGFNATCLVPFLFHLLGL